MPDHPPAPTPPAPTPPPDAVDVDALADLALTEGFRAGVYAAVRLIPPGRVLGYGHVAVLIGRPRAARQVGYALAALEPGTDVPWWRVLRSDGSIALQGDPERGPRQAELLQAEGVDVVDWRLDMDRYGWQPVFL